MPDGITLCKHFSIKLIKFSTLAGRPAGSGMAASVPTVDAVMLESFGRQKMHDPAAAAGIAPGAKPSTASEGLLAPRRVGRGIHGRRHHLLAMCAVVVSKTSCKDRNHRILRGVIAPHQDFFCVQKS